MKRGNSLSKGWFTSITLAALTTAQCWADATVHVRYSGFSPSSVSIGVGETVWFIVDDDMGPYLLQSTTGAWTPWYLFDEGEGVGITFNERGDYYYRDGFSFNSGVVHVGAAATNIPPIVSITGPAEGTVYTAPATVQLSADASDDDSGMWFVEFYLGSDLVDTLYWPPYSTTITGLEAGNHTLTVKAYDSQFVVTTKSVNITVQPATSPTILLSAPTLVGGEFRFAATGLTSGKQVVLLGSTGLAGAGTWTSLQTNVANGDSMTFPIPMKTGAEFFRVEQLP